MSCFENKCYKNKCYKNKCYKNNCGSFTSFGLDYFDVVNNLIKNILYPKPVYDKSIIKKLKFKERTKLFYITNEKLNIKTCVCQIMPKKNYYHKIIIFSHGNGCDIYTFYEYLKSIADNFDDLDDLNDLDDLGVLVVMYDYPSYGLSVGELNEFTCYQSLEDVINYYKKYTENILLVGQSLGTGIVVDYVSKNQWTKPIILISPYKSIPKIITDYTWIENLVCKNKFASYLKISNTKCPIKIFHGESDNLISHTHSIELYNLMPNKKFKPIIYANCGHNDILNKISFDEYRQILELL